MKRAIIAFVAFFFGLSQAHAYQQALVGFTEDVRLSLTNDFLWYEVNLPDSRMLRILSVEHMGPERTDPKGIVNYITTHFPLAMSDTQSVRTCPTAMSQCQQTSFEEWPQQNVSVQQLAMGLMGLYTPYLDRKFETTVIGYDPQRWLSVSSPNQTIAVINERAFSNYNDNSTDYGRWVKLSQWLGLARLHQIFASGGDALKQCTADNGTRYICEGYDNGALYFAGVTLLAGSVECGRCSDKDKAMLKILAFDHLLRTGKSEKSEKLINFLKDDMIKLMKQGAKDPQVAGLIDMYRERHYRANHAPSFIPKIENPGS